jgi:hypothetical protein
LEAVGVSRPTWLRKNMEAAFESFMEKKWRDALNVAEIALWVSNSTGAEKWSHPPGKVVGAKADAVQAASRGGQEKRNVSILPSPEMAGRPSA